KKHLWPLYLGGVIPPMGGVGILTLLPVIARDWGMSIQWISLSVTVYMVPFAVFQLFAGPIAQVFDTRKTLLFGFGVYALGAILSGLSPNLTVLLIARFIWGFGAAFVSPIIVALVGDRVDPQRMGRSMGLLQASYTCGVTMGPLVSGLLEVALGWPAFFLFLGGLAVFNGIFYWVTTGPEKKREMGSKRILDALPFVKQAASIADVRFLSLAAFFLFLSFIGLMTFVAEYLKAAFSLSSDKIGFVLSMTGILGIAASPVAGILGDRMGRRPVAYAGGGTMIAAILGMEVLDYSYSTYLVLFSLFGIGSATAWASLLTLVVEMIPDLRKPVVSFYNAVKFMGYALAPLILSIFYIPFSISGVRWACMISILTSLFLTSRIQSKVATRAVASPLIEGD
ncbi:MAG: MFS transporter, partial [Deltaproteobacteria bacterium]|nr:MFS transporter [Deltaproteobacteria bacterium]